MDSTHWQFKIIDGLPTWKWCHPTIAIGSNWRPKKGGLPWKLTDIFHSEMGRIAVQLEKYQGGRNSPAIITTKKLKENFEHLP